MTEKRTLMQIFDDWRLVYCDPYPPRGMNERSEAFAGLFSIMKKEGYTRSEIERKMIDPILGVSVSPTLKDKKLAKSLTKSTEEAFRRGLSLAFAEDYDNKIELNIPEKKVENTYVPKKQAPEPEPALKKDIKTVYYDDVKDSGFDFRFGGLFDKLDDGNEGNDE